MQCNFDRIHGMSTHEDPLLEPTNEYALRHAANGLIDFANRHRELPAAELDLIDYAYKQLHRGANTIRGLGVTP